MYIASHLTLPLGWSLICNTAVIILFHCFTRVIRKTAVTRILIGNIIPKPTPIAPPLPWSTNWQQCDYPGIV